MIKFFTRGNDGRPFLGIGLSRENLRRLHLGQPILFDAREVGYIDANVLIMVGETEETMRRQIADVMQVFICPLCGRLSRHPEDIKNEYCSCCGNDSLPKPCEHRPTT